MSPKMSPETQCRIDMMYPREQREEVTKYLEAECGHNIPGVRPDDDEFALERLRFVALKVSNVSLESLKKAVDLAKRDYRDLLGAAGFAVSTTKNKGWFPKGVGPQ